MTTPTRRSQTATRIAATVLGATVALGAAVACSKKESTGDIPGTSTTTAPAAATTEAPNSTGAPATTSSPDTTRAPRTTTTRGTPTSQESGRVGPDRLGGIDTLEFDLLESAAPYRSYGTVSDDTGRVRVDLPVTWDTDTSVRTIQGTDVPNVLAALDLQDWRDGRSTPALRVAGYEGALKDKGIDWALDHEAEVDKLGTCSGPSERFPFDARGYQGTAVVTAGCGPRAQDVAVLIAAAPASGDGDLAVLGATLVTDADVEVLARAIESFEVPTS